MITRRSLLKASAMCLGLLRTRLASAADTAARRLAHHTAGSFEDHLRTEILFRGEPGYEPERLASVWNARKPPRYPKAIVMAKSVSDVVDAVELAKARGWKVAARSGGHSWTAPHVRDDAILINLRRMREISVHPDKRIAIVSPSWEGQALNKILREQYGLMFPSGHCHGVGLGGFIMCGGHGWNSRLWGPACANLNALDVVTAEGTLIHASETENSDYLWAARGAGPGFYGVAVRFYLKVHPLPTSMKRSVYVYPADVVDELFVWLGSIQNVLPKYLEASVIAGKDESGRQVLQFSGAALAPSEADADSALALLDRCPVLDRAISKQLRIPTIFPADQVGPHETNPAGARYVIDGTWTSAPATEIIPAIRKFLINQPTPQSYFLWLCWGPVQLLQDMAYSLQGDTYLSPCGVNFQATDDARCAEWVAEAVKAMEPFSLGGQMNDENMAVNQRQYLSHEAHRRLEIQRDRYDPTHLFAGFLTAADSNQQA